MLAEPGEPALGLVETGGRAFFAATEAWFAEEDSLAVGFVLLMLALVLAAAGLRVDFI